MKKLLILSALLLSISPLTADAQRRIAGTPVEKFTIVYSSATEDEEGLDIARTLQQQLVAGGLPELAILPDSAFRRGKALRILPAPEKEPFGYGIQLRRGDLTIDGTMELAGDAHAGYQGDINGAGSITGTGTLQDRGGNLTVTTIGADIVRDSYTPEP